MSHFTEVVLEFKDREALITALMAMGFRRDQIEVHDEAVSLYGYQGDKREQEAHVVIRRRAVGPMSNDIGFERTSDGRYRAHISEYDLNRYGKPWQDKLKQEYGCAVSVRDLQREGYKLVKREALKDGAVRLILTDE